MGHDTRLYTCLELYFTGIEQKRSCFGVDGFSRFYLNLKIVKDLKHLISFIPEPKTSSIVTSPFDSVVLVSKDLILNTLSGILL